MLPGLGRLPYLFLAGISGGCGCRCDLCEPFQRRSPQHTHHHEGGDFDRFYYDRSRHDLLGAGPDQSALLLANSGLLQPDFRHEHWRDGASVLYPLVFVLMCVALQQGNYVRELVLKWLDPIISFFAKFRVALDWITFYPCDCDLCLTGFLISALIRFPLINTAVLPALFVASGFSAGCAATKSFGRLALRCRSSRLRSACSSCG